MVLTGFSRADAIASLVVVALMVKAGVGLVRESSRILLEAAPRPAEPGHHRRGTGRALRVRGECRHAVRKQGAHSTLSPPPPGSAPKPTSSMLEWSQLLAGRARAMEFVLSSDDFDADTAELYGLVNRSIPDAELDAYVHKLARRIASFNPAAVAMVKSYLTKRQPIPLPADLADSSAAAGRLQSTDAGKAVAARLIAKAGGVPFDFEVELDLPKLCDVE